MRWTWAAVLAGAAAVLLLAWALYDTLFPVFLGFALAYAFDPVADRLERLKLSRSTAVALIVAAVAAFVVGAVALIVPPLVSELQRFALDFPGYAAAAHDRLAAFAQAWGLRLPQGRDELLLRLRGWLQGVSVSALSPAGVLAGRVFSSAAGTLVGLLNLIIVPVVFFYFLRDITPIRLGVLALVPKKLRSSAEARLDEADRVFAGYLRGQLTVSLILAVVYSIGLSLIGIRFGVLIGLASGLLNVVPFLGVALGLVVSLVMAAVDSAGWGPFVAVLALFGAAQAAEGMIITPRIVGDKVGLSAVETIIALILGGEFGGLSGMVLAIPLAGCLKAWAKDAAYAWRKSAYFKA